MRTGISALLAANLAFTAPALAASEGQDQGTLAPGGAAGVQQAEDFSIPIALSIVGVVGAGVAVAILVSNSHNGSTTATKSTSK